MSKIFFALFFWLGKIFIFDDKNFRMPPLNTREEIDSKFKHLFRSSLLFLFFVLSAAWSEIDSQTFTILFGAVVATALMLYRRSLIAFNLIMIPALLIADYFTAYYINDESMQLSIFSPFFQFMFNFDFVFFWFTLRANQRVS